MTNNEFWLLVILIPLILFSIVDLFSGKLGDKIDKYIDVLEKESKSKKKGGKK